MDNIGILKFAPIYKETVWGGRRIAELKGIPPSGDHIGESWEISGVSGSESVVSEGRYAGLVLGSLCSLLKDRLLGRHVLASTGEEFPLLIKFIDANADLSVQVHPDDALAAKRHSCRGKTEMWYVLGAEPGASLLSGLSKPIDRERYGQMVADGSIMDCLTRYYVKPGDVFFLPAGRIHAIGAGCLIAEIQQTSDITYRIYDYGRLGLDGKPRQLHTGEAIDAIDYSVLPDYRTAYMPAKDRETVVADCRYFRTSVLDLTAPFEKDIRSLDSFLVAMCLEGAGTASCASEPGVKLRRGETILFPADSPSVTFIPDGNMKLLTSYMPKI